MSDYITSIIRTGVPAIWGLGISWLIARIPAVEQIRTELEGIGLVLALACIAGYYALVRKVEPHLPDWLRPILIGSTKAPAVYVTKPQNVVGALTDDGQVIDTSTGRHVDGTEPV